MTTLIQTNTAATLSPVTRMIRAIISPVATGLRSLKAYQDMRRFQMLDADRLRDVGLTPRQAETLTLRDFMAQPRR